MTAPVSRQTIPRPLYRFSLHPRWYRISINYLRKLTVSNCVISRHLSQKWSPTNQLNENEVWILCSSYSHITEKPLKLMNHEDPTIKLEGFPNKSTQNHHFCGPSSSSFSLGKASDVTAIRGENCGVDEMKWNLLNVKNRSCVHMCKKVLYKSKSIIIYHNSLICYCLTRHLHWLIKWLDPSQIIVSQYLTAIMIIYDHAKKWLQLWIHITSLPNHQGTKAPRVPLHKGWHQRCRCKAGIGRRACSCQSYSKMCQWATKQD